MKCVKKYDLRSTADIDAAKLMSNGIPSTVTGHDKAPQVLSDFTPEKIEITVANRDYARAMMVLKNNDSLVVKAFKILTYRSKNVDKIIHEKKSTTTAIDTTEKDKPVE